MGLELKIIEHLSFENIICGILRATNELYMCTNPYCKTHVK